MTAPPSTGLDPAQYAALAAFRHQLRRFLRFSEDAALHEGLPPQQHQALLAIAGHDGATPPGIGFLAEQLIIAPHSAAELAARMIEAGLLTKTRCPADRRRQNLALTPAASALLARLTAVHLAELGKLAPALSRALARLAMRTEDGTPGASGRGPRRSAADTG